MKKILLLLFFFSSSIKAVVDEDGDVQLWLTSTTIASITDHLKTGVINEVRIGDDISIPFFLFTQPQLFIRVHKWVEIAPGYRQIFSRFQRARNSWHPTYSPFFDLSFIFPIKKGEISCRNRVQYLIHSRRKNRALYRNRIRFIFPMTISPLNIQPYTDNEIFILEGRGLSQNRFTAGVFTTFTKNMKVRLYYMMRLLKTPVRWNTNNIMGIEYFLLF